MPELWKQSSILQITSIENPGVKTIQSIRSDSLTSWIRIKMQPHQRLLTVLSKLCSTTRLKKNMNQRLENDFSQTFSQPDCKFYYSLSGRKAYRAASHYWDGIFSTSKHLKIMRHLMSVNDKMTNRGKNDWYTFCACFTIGEGKKSNNPLQETDGLNDIHSTYHQSNTQRTMKIKWEIVTFICSTFFYLQFVYKKIILMPVWKLLSASQT